MGRALASAFIEKAIARPCRCGRQSCRRSARWGGTAGIMKGIVRRAGRRITCGDPTGVFPRHRLGSGRPSMLSCSIRCVSERLDGEQTPGHPAHPAGWDRSSPDLDTR